MAQLERWQGFAKGGGVEEQDKVCRVGGQE
ncbi:hypothetical protein CEB3_c09930 [Peptococcaceae bacterium CEB3]|nr:hypothetical protein CEB3_c09930 [Peptococcaceae bacterium CEB3]